MQEEYRERTMSVFEYEQAHKDLPRNQRIAQYFRYKALQMGWRMNAPFGKLIDVPEVFMSRANRSIEGTSQFKVLVKYCYGHATRLDDLAHMLGLDAEVRAIMKDPQYRHLYRELWYLEDGPIGRDLEKLVEEVPPDRKEDTKNRIKAIILEAKSK